MKSLIKEYVKIASWRVFGYIPGLARADSAG